MGKTLRLASFDVGGGIFPSIQGYGIMVGTPMVFLRLHGCDFSCAWCDTKETWREGSIFTEVDVEEVARKIAEFPETWVSVTGGNPLLQADAIVDLIGLLPDKRFMVETQASIHHSGLYRAIHLASFSPKLHDLRLDTLQESFFPLQVERTPTQVNIVVTTEDETERALMVMLEIYRRWVATSSYYRDLAPSPVFYLLPEFKTGRVGVQTAIRVLRDRMTAGFGLEVRILPQVHKLALFVP